MSVGRFRAGTPGMSVTDDDIPFSMTPILEDSLQLLMITCISLQDNETKRILDGDNLQPIEFRFSEGICPKISMKASNLDMLSIRLTAVECMRPVYDLWVTVGDSLYHECIKLPYLLTNCRASYFPISCLNATVCIVHELVEIRNDETLFVEEQEFLFSAMEIQDHLFLRNCNPPQPIHFIESNVVDDEEVFSQELKFLSSIMDKYIVN